MPLLGPDNWVFEGGGGGTGTGWVGEVADYASLPAATGSGDVYLVLNSTGFLWNRRRGLYRDEGVGVWTRLSKTTFEVVDTELEIVDDADNTKVLDFELSGITTGTTRTLSVPDFDGEILTDTYPMENTAHVSKGGNDTTGTVGVISKPFLTIQAAIDAITTAATDNRFNVVVSGGDYTENVVLKDYICLRGEGNSTTRILGTSGSLLTLPSVTSRVYGIDILLTPTTDGHICVDASSGGIHHLGEMRIEPVSATNGITAKSIILDGGEMTVDSCDIRHTMTGSSAGSVSHKVIDLQTDARMQILGGSIIGVFGDVDDTIEIIGDDSTGSFFLVGTFVLGQMTNAAYSGSMYVYRNTAEVGASDSKDIANDFMRLIGAGSGTGYAISAETTTGTTITLTATDTQVSNFTTKCIGYADANDTINFSFTSLKDGTTPFDGTGTINRVYIQDNELIVNTDIIDTNLYLTGATNTSLGDLFNITFSAGWVSGGGITDNLDGTVDIAAGTGIIRTSDDEQAPIKSFDWSASAGLALTDGQANYIYVDYNAGTPQIAVTTTPATVLDNENTLFELYEVVREGTTLHISDHKHRAKNVPGKLQQYLYSKATIERADSEGGLILGETGTRNVTVTAGKIWIKLQDSAISAVDTSGADTFDRYYQDGVGGWTKTTGNTQWDNLQYDDGSGTLAAIPLNKYCFQDFYIDADGDLVSLYAQDTYNTQAQAENAPTSSSLPTRIASHALLIGRVVFQQNDATARSVLSSFTTTFSAASVTDHGSLAGLLDDDHTQYTLLAGRSGGQIINGGTGSGDDLTLNTTSDGTKGDYILPDIAQANGIVSVDGSGVLSSAEWAEANILYVGKHGNDSNDGTTQIKAFLTIGAAITEAISLTPSSSNRIKIQILDAGNYTENLTIPEWVGVLGDAALITGAHVMNDNTALESFRLYGDLGAGTRCIQKNTGTGFASVNCPRMILPSGVTGVYCTSGAVNYTGHSMELQGTSSGLLPGVGATINASIELISLSANGVALNATGAGGIINFTGESISDAGNASAIRVTNTGTVNAIIGSIDCNAAYAVTTAGGTLNLMCTSMSGTTDDTGTVNIITADAGAMVSGDWKFNSGSINVGGGDTTSLRLGENIETHASGDYAGLSLNTWSTTSGHSPVIDFNRSGSNTIGTQTALGNDYDIGFFVFRGSDGVAFRNSGALKCEADAAFSSGSSPGRLVFQTVSDGSTSLSERMRITSDGYVGIHETNPDGYLHTTVDDNTIAFKAERTDAVAYIQTFFGGGSSAFKYSVNNAASFVAGIHDLGSDSFKISYGSADNATFGTNDYITLTTAGYFGIATDSPSSYLDVSFGGDTVVLGGDNGATTRTDATAKLARIGAVHYTNAEENVSMLACLSDSTNNRVSFGGGSGTQNAATQMRFYTAANQTTTTGTERMRIASDGGIYMYALPTGATAGGAGAGTNELWVTSGHATLPDGVVMLG